VSAQPACLAVSKRHFPTFCTPTYLPAPGSLSWLLSPVSTSDLRPPSARTPPYCFKLLTPKRRTPKFPEENIDQWPHHVDGIRLSFTRDMAAIANDGAGLADSPEQDRQRPKRRRIGYACNQCRTKKNRCDGDRPVCGPCGLRQLECVYSAQKSRTTFTQE
jgi:hypothetical protein